MARTLSVVSLLFVFSFAVGIKELVAQIKSTSNDQFKKMNLQRDMAKERELLTARMTDNGVVPKVVNSVPDHVLTVRFANGAEANLGNELTPTLVENKPTEVKWQSEANKLYTLACVDPDAPTRRVPIFGQWKHWLVVNIPGGNITRGETVAEYKGAGPLRWTGFHRYVYMVYEQPLGRIEHDMKRVASTSREGRRRFSLKKFAQKYSLREPVAGNFYLSRHE